MVTSIWVTGSPFTVQKLVKVVPNEVEPKKIKGIARRIAITITLLPDKKFLSNSNIRNASYLKANNHT